MMKPVEFMIIKLSTDQFALLRDMYIPDAPVAVYTQLSFGFEEKEKIVAVSASFRFESDEKNVPFIVLETKAYFQISPESWECMYESGTNTLTLDKGFARHLSVIVVGTSRGILHNRTDGTELNHIVLPLINVEQILKEDVVINISERQ